MPARLQHVACNLEMQVRGNDDDDGIEIATLQKRTMVGDDVWAKWPISPGSGTGELEGIRGEARIDIAPDGAHTLFLEYDL